jgi:hypothetical protein
MRLRYMSILNATVKVGQMMNNMKKHYPKFLHTHKLYSMSAKSVIIICVDNVHLRIYKILKLVCTCASLNLLKLEMLIRLNIFL